MTLSLHVETQRWRTHLAAVVAESPGLVPVAKGNGYGFGLERLGAEATRLGVDTVAVGLPEEVAPVRSAFAGSVLVLTPAHSGTADAPHEPHVIRTVSHLETLRALAAGDERPRVVLELATSMRRHGLAESDLAEVGPLLPGVDLQGWALHLPLVGAHLPEARAAVALLRRLDLPLSTLWVSHLSVAEVRGLTEPGLAVRPRVGTALWLGDRGAFRATGTVLDVHPLAPGDSFGYRRARARRRGTLLVVSGGTAHGVGLEAPKAVRGPLSRAKVLAIGMLGAAGWALSPFTVGGRQRWYGEPPHMQVSLVLLPAKVAPPALGDEVAVDVRMTTTTFDRICWD